MATEIDSLQDDILEIKKDVEFIKHALLENNELSDETVRELDKARKTPESEYIELE